MHYKINDWWRWLSFLLLGILFSLRIAFADGGIVTDGTVGPAQTLTGANVTIPQNLGATVGNNLFHSFSQFNVNTGQTVTFSENAPNRLDNVVSRVTGGTQSDINGTLASTPGGHANLYLVNPSGVVFGQNAQINVPGAFHASTADEVRFQDGGKFSASQPAASTLTAAAPASFGFLGTTSATNGLLKVDGAQLAVKPGQTLDMVGRQISVENGAALSAPAGEIRLVASGAGEANVPVSTPPDVARGSVNIESSTLDASGDGAGKLAMQGREVFVTSSTLLANNTGDTDAAVGQGVDIRVDSLEVHDGSQIRTNNLGSGRGGDITIAVANEMNVTDSTIGAAVETGSGLGGNIKVNAKNLIIDSPSGKESAINTRTSPDSTGKAGSIEVSVAEKMSLNNKAYISSDSFSTGDTGSVNISAGSIDMASKASIETDVQPGSTGNGGSLAVKVDRDLNLQTGAYIYSGFYEGEEVATGHPGPIVINAGGDITLQDDSYISTWTQAVQTSVMPNAGAVTIEAGGSLKLLTGGRIYNATFDKIDGGNIAIKADAISIDGKDSLTGIYSDTSASGKAGNVTVESGNQLDIFNGAVVKSTTSGFGESGEVTVMANAITMDNGEASGTGIYTTTSGPGNAGNVNVHSNGYLDILNGATISSFPLFFGSGDSGNVTVTSGSLKINAKTNQKGYTGIISGPSDCLVPGFCNTGKAGSVYVESNGAIEIVNGGAISNSSFGKGDAGAVTVKAHTLRIEGSDNQSFTGIYANSNDTGKGGNVNVETSGALSIALGGVIDTSTSGLGSAGEINVKAGKLQVDGWRVRYLDNMKFPEPSGIFSEATSISSGQAGNVTVIAKDAIQLSNSGKISVENLGNAPEPTSVKAGNLTVNAPTLELDGGVITASTGGNVRAGSVTVNASKTLVAKNGSQIRSATTGLGSAGTVSVDSPLLFINNSAISAEAGLESGGQTGDVIVNAGESLTLANQSKISIENFSNVADTANIKAGTITVSSPDIYLTNSNITTQSAGKVDAGSIAVNFVDQLFLGRESYISTESNNGNGGAVTVQGGQLIQLIDSGFKTNVLGRQNGNGGNISVTADSLVMETGLIQANTKAPRASGGDITLNLKALVSSGNTLIKGGDQPVAWEPYVFGLNVIQAAAPNGVSGRIQSTAPQLNLSGVLSNLGGPQFDTRAISEDYCSLGTGSSLTRKGKGGLLPRSRDSLMY